ncbi:MAG TPA: hypothetical protein VE439_08650, partial [Anaerolineae bacterium]|nr:hypothetical protein [Anaerolineae bacterium]
IKGLPQSPKWITVGEVEIKQLNHAIKPKGMDCGNCHSKNGIMDFKALGYSKEEVEVLSRPQSLVK